METVSTGVDILRAHSGHASTNALDRTKTRTSITTDLAIPTAGCISTCKEGDEGDENWRELHDCLWGIWCCVGVGVGVDVCVCVGVGVSLGFVWRDVLYKLANSSSTFQTYHRPLVYILITSEYLYTTCKVCSPTPLFTYLPNPQTSTLFILKKPSKYENDTTEQMPESPKWICPAVQYQMITFSGS